MAEQDFDLTEEATPYKLEKARRQGTVAKSPDVTAAGILVTLVGTLYAIGWDRMVLSMRLQQAVLGHITRSDWTVDGVAAWMGQLAANIVQLLSPLLLALVLAAIVLNVAQTGPVFTLTPLAPDFDRINPANGFKRIFSLRILYECGKSLVKLIVLGVIAYVAIAATLPRLVRLSAVDPKGYARLLVDLTASVLIKMVLALVVIAIIDFTYTRWEFARRMRMSKRDVRDESKQREGDPRIRARIRELRKDMLKRSQAMKNLPSADVLITNPTHVAVALCYKHGQSSAPQLTAKGAGEMARKMRELAIRHHIPIVQNKPLARALFREVDFDGFVPEKWYSQVAKIMVWVYVLRDARRQGAAA